MSATKLPEMDLRAAYSSDPETVWRRVRGSQRAKDRLRREWEHYATLDRLHREKAREEREALIQARVRAWREGRPTEASA